MDEAWLKDLFQPFGPVSVRRMFGGAGIYRDGLMFALSAEGEVYLKADRECVELFERAGSRPFTFEAKGRRTQTSYWLMPEEAVDDPDRLRYWAELAWAAALRNRKPARPASRKPRA